MTEAQEDHGLQTIIDSRLKQALLLTPFTAVVTASVQFPLLDNVVTSWKNEVELSHRIYEVERVSERASIHQFRFDTD